MRKLVVMISSALVFPLLFLLYSTPTRARVDRTGSEREAVDALPQGLTESLFFDAVREQIPEAVVVLTIKNDGTIFKVSFKERSHNELFDESIVSAIEKSAPLPEFPPDYEKLYDEIEIRFSLKGTLLR